MANTPPKIQVLNNGIPVEGAKIIVGETGVSKTTDTEGMVALPELNDMLPMVTHISTQAFGFTFFTLAILDLNTTAMVAPNIPEE